MATSTEPIVVQIINEGASATKSAIGGGSSGGSAVGGIAKLTGLIGVVAEIAGLVKEAVNGLIKPIKSVLLGILKMVAQILRPFSDMILILLIPILQFLKPLMKAFNEVMKPFRKVAMQLMGAAGNTSDSTAKAGLMTAAFGAIIEGFQYGILTIFKELLKVMMSNIIDLIKNMIISPLIELFKVVVPNWIVNDDIFDSVKNVIFAGLDIAKSDINTALDKNITDASEVSIKKYNNILQSFNNKVDWKTPEDILASKMSQMLREAAKKATQKVRVSLTSQDTERVTNTQIAQNALGLNNAEMINWALKNNANYNMIMG